MLKFKISTVNFNPIYYFLLPISRKVLFRDKISELEIWMDLRVLKSPESENHILRIWSVCMCDCYQHNAKTNHSRIFKFGSLHLYRR